MLMARPVNAGPDSLFLEMTLLPQGDSPPEKEEDRLLVTIDHRVGARMIEPIPTGAEAVEIKAFSLEEIKARLTTCKKVLSVRIDCEDLSDLIVFVNECEFVRAGK
jgi:hypothetical protein